MDDITIIDKDNLPEPILNEKGQVIDGWYINPQGKPIHVIAGDNQHITKSGSIYDDTIHRLVSPSITGAITPSNARDMLEARREIKVKAALQAISGASVDKSLRVGLREIFEAQVRLAKNEGAYSTRAAEFVIKEAGLSSKEDNAPTGVSITIDRETALEIVDAIRKRRESEGE